MIYFKSLCLSALVLGLNACVPVADEVSDNKLQVTPQDSTSFDTAAMDRLLSSAVERGDVIGVQALVFDEGQTVYRKSFGLADRERNVPVKSDTVYRVYSMTKPVTSQMKVVSLGVDGQPKFEDQIRPMTIEDLLLHRAGMAYGIFGGNPIEDAWAKAGLVDPQTAVWTKCRNCRFWVNPVNSGSTLTRSIFWAILRKSLRAKP